MIDIIIPTFNRPQYLKRLLSFYDTYTERDFSIIIADSSLEKNKIKNRAVVTQYPSLKINYLDYPNAIDGWHKQADAIDHVRAKYCVFCADDDFITLTGIRQSIEFLEGNSDFVVAQGQYLSFCITKNQLQWIPTKYAHESIDSVDPTVRLTQHLSEYSQTTFYAVHRTELLKTIYSELLKSSYNGVLFGELLLSMLTIIYGKLKYLDVFYSVRDPYSSATTVRPNLKIESNSSEYNQFRSCIAVYLSRQSKISMEEALTVTDKAFIHYVEKYLPKEII